MTGHPLSAGHEKVEQVWHAVFINAVLVSHPPLPNTGQ